MYDADRCSRGGHAVTTVSGYPALHALQRLMQSCLCIPTDPDSDADSRSAVGTRLRLLLRSGSRQRRQRLSSVDRRRRQSRRAQRRHFQRRRSRYLQDSLDARVSRYLTLCCKSIALAVCITQNEPAGSHQVGPGSVSVPVFRVCIQSTSSPAQLPR